MNQKRSALIPAISLAFAMAGCKGAAPTLPTVFSTTVEGAAELQVSAVAIGTIAPPTGTSIAIPPQYPYNQIGGVILPKNSGVISVSGTLRLASDVAYAQLNIYLLTGSGSTYCGQNSPDSPAWYDLKAGWSTGFTISGWQIFGLPNDVKGVRVMLHRRQSGLGTPPKEGETIAETTAPVNWHIAR